jgi:hypothetical protein
MKYLLKMYINPKSFAALPEDEQDAVLNGHEVLQKDLSESGEMVETKALADPSTVVTVRVRDDSAQVTDGPYQPMDDVFCGYYIVDCATKQRAIELAGHIPEARYNAIEVQEIVYDTRD